MIREWCEECGERFVMTKWEHCPMKCNSMKCCASYEVPAAAEAFWTAITFERAKYEIALRHMVGFGRGPVPASGAFLAGAPGFIVRRVTADDARASMRAAGFVSGGDVPTKGEG